MGRFDHRWGIVIVAVLTVTIWQVPYGWQILYPLTVLATYAHEMGHGLTALLVGGTFSSLEMYANGSGLAQCGGNVGRIGGAMISAGGLVGPSIFGAIFLAMTRKPKMSRWVLYVVGVGMLISVLLLVRSIFGVFFVSAMGLAILGLAHVKKGRFAPFALQVLGVQLCLAIYRDISYMFSPNAVVDGVERLSDSGAMAANLFLPYWFWGGLTALFSFVVLALGVYVAWRPGSQKERGKEWESIASPTTAGQ